jgi:hypothetical protein
MISNLLNAVTLGFVSGAVGAAAFLFLRTRLESVLPHSHEWDEYKPATAWIVTPYRDDNDRVALERRFKSKCTVEGCEQTNIEYRQATHDLYASGIEDAIQQAPEIHNECPACETAVAVRNIDVDGDGFRDAKIYRCPECDNLTPDTLWNRVPYEQLSA